MMKFIILDNSGVSAMTDKESMASASGCSTTASTHGRI